MGRRSRSSKRASRARIAGAAAAALAAGGAVWAQSGNVTWAGTWAPLLPTWAVNAWNDAEEWLWVRSGAKVEKPLNDEEHVPLWMNVVGRVRFSAQQDMTGWGEPVILKSTAATGWNAVKEWDRDFVERKFPNSSQVYRNKDKSGLFVYEDDKQFMRHVSEDLNQAIAQPKVEKISMTMQEFFSQEEPMYISTMWDHTFEAAELDEDISPREFLFVLPENTGKKMAIGDRDFSLNLWMAKVGTVTGLHYDGAHNMYAQVHGCKRFLLVPPWEWQAMNIFPVGHINDRQSQLEVTGENATRVNAFIADLGPGDVLYLPPYWGHRVAAFECNDSSLSISVNAWSPASGEAISAKLAALEDLPKRFLGEMGFSQMDVLSQAAIFLDFIISGTSSLTSAQIFKDIIVEKKYTAQKSLGDALGCSGFAVERCPADLVRMGAEYKRKNPELTSQLRREAKQFIQILQSSSDLENGVQDLLLTEFVERVTAFVASLPNACPFLLCASSTLKQ